MTGWKIIFNRKGIVMNKKYIISFALSLVAIFGMANVSYAAEEENTEKSFREQISDSFTNFKEEFFGLLSGEESQTPPQDEGDSEIDNETQAPEESENGEVEDADQIDISNPGSGTGWISEDNVITFDSAANGKTYELTGETSEVRIVIPEGVQVELILNDVSISNELSPIELQGNAEVTLHLEDGTKNEIICTNTSKTNINVAGITVPETATLIIEGEGQLNVQGGTNGAGIGGGRKETCGTVDINTGTVNVVAGEGAAGIGGGYKGNGGEISIEEAATVTSVSSGTSPAIADTDEVNDAENPTNIVNALGEIPVSDTVNTTLQMSDESNEYASEMTLPANYQNFAFTTGAYSGGVSVTALDENTTISNTQLESSTSFTTQDASFSTLIEVTFDAQGGTEVPSVEVSEDGAVEEPEIPVKEGFTFTGWYTESACENLFDFSSPVTESMTLYAGWNSVPVAENDAFKTVENQILEDETVAEGDTDVEGDALTYAVETDVENGILELSEDGTFSYTPNDDFSGTDTFTYVVKDENGGSASAEVKIRVTPVADESAVTEEQEPVEEPQPAEELQPSEEEIASTEAEDNEETDLNTDTDSDGLSDAEEVDLGTDPAVYDTDQDGLSDGDEVFIGTDPLNVDTDGDGFTDGDEIENGTNPFQVDEVAGTSEESAGTTAEDSEQATEETENVDTSEEPKQLQARVLPVVIISVGVTWFILNRRDKKRREKENQDVE